MTAVDFELFWESINAKLNFGTRECSKRAEGFLLSKIFSFIFKVKNEVGQTVQTPFG